MRGLWRVREGVVAEVASVSEAQGAAAQALGAVLARLGGLQKPQVWAQEGEQAQAATES